MSSKFDMTTGENLLNEASKGFKDTFNTAKKKYNAVDKQIANDPSMQAALGNQQTALLETMRKTSESWLKASKIVVDHVLATQGGGDGEGDGFPIPETMLDQINEALDSSKHMKKKIK